MLELSRNKLLVLVGLGVGFLREHCHLGEYMARIATIYLLNSFK